MHNSGSLPLTFEGPKQDFGGKNCQNRSRGKNFVHFGGHSFDPKVVKNCQNVNLC